MVWALRKKYAVFEMNDKISDSRMATLMNANEYFWFGCVGWMPAIWLNFRTDRNNLISTAMTAIWHDVYVSTNYTKLKLLRFRKFRLNEMGYISLYLFMFIVLLSNHKLLTSRSHRPIFGIWIVQCTIKPKIQD